MKTYEMLFRNLQTHWKQCKYNAEPRERWDTAQESSELLEAMQIPPRATWEYVKYCSGIFRPIEAMQILIAEPDEIRKKYHSGINRHFSYANTPRRATWKYVTYRSGIFRSIGSHANPPRRPTRKYLKYRSGIFRPIGSHANIPRRATWKYVKYRSGIFRPIGSYAKNTSQSYCENTWSIAQASSDLLEAMHIHLAEPRENTWNIVQASSDQIHLAEPRENTWNIAQEFLDLLKAMQMPRRAT